MRICTLVVVRDAEAGRWPMMQWQHVVLAEKELSQSRQGKEGQGSGGAQEGNRLRRETGEARGRTVHRSLARRPEAERGRWDVPVGITRGRPAMVQLATVGRGRI